MKKEKTCCFTGHRKIPLEEYQKIEINLKILLTKLINNGIIYFCTGGALGFDTLVAKIILLLKKDYPQIKLTLILPCIDQTKNWKTKDIQIYKYIKEHCDDVIYTSKEYSNGCMFKRNRRFVDNSSICICYLTKQKGGTYYTVNYAKSKGLKVINIGE